MTPGESQLCESLPTVESDRTASLSPWQFSLRDIFWLTTAAAGVAAVAAVKGAGSLVISIGLVVAWLNARGRLAPVQTRKARPKVFYVAWGLLAASLFLPAMKGCNNKPIYGWQTAYACAATQADGVAQLVLQGPPEERPSLSDVGSFVWFTLINLANGLALLSPFWLWRLQRGRGEWFGAVLAVAVIGVWAVPLRDPTNLLVGCYVWCAGFAVLLAAHRLRFGVLAAMCALAVVFLLG